MDEALLAEARQAQERLIDAERDADVARAEFHRAVRRLHPHGASPRHVAPRLGPRPPPAPARPRPARARLRPGPQPPAGAPDRRVGRRFAPLAAPRPGPPRS